GVIGQNILAFADTEYDLANGTVNLMKTEGCGGTNLAYWAQGKFYAMTPLLPGAYEMDRHIYAEGQVNGHTVKLMFDTGAPTTVMNRAAAERAGIDLSAPGVVESEGMGGIGRKQRRSWIVRLDSFELGGEQISHTPIRVIDENEQTFDVLVGADFFLSHHLFVSRATRRLFVTYNGGPVFSLTTDGEIGELSTRAEGNVASSGDAVPVDAAGFARRANARLSRRDWSGAVADFDEALRRQADQPEWLRGRAEAHGRLGDGAKARADFDRAVALAPDDPELLLRRGFGRAEDGDKAGALADADAAVARFPAGSFDRLKVLGLFERLHRPDRELALLDPIIALHKDDRMLGELLNTRCWARALANIALDQALADCSTAIRRDGPRGAYLDSRGLVRVRRGDWTGAIADYDAAIAANPKAAPSLFMRGWAKRASGAAEAGAADMAAARAIDPDVAERFVAAGLAG
ncbi:MAG: hypothetical protein RIS94_3198, partial [Pseudomonadota bacterium]